MTARTLLSAVLAMTALAACDRIAPVPGAADIAANNRGVGLMGMFKYSEAHDVFAALVPEHPGWTDVRVNLAIALLNRQQDGDESSAMEILRTVLETDPDDLRARYCAGLLMYRSGEPGALEHLQFVVGSDPDDPYSAYFYGSALEQAGRTGEAEAMYRRAIDLDPYLRSAIYRLSRILLRSDRADDGLALQETFQKLADNPRARTVDFIYTRMGSKALALAVGIADPAPVPRPEGAILTEPAALLDDGERYAWHARTSSRPACMTACDLDGDGRVDLFIADALREGHAVNAVIMSSGDGTWSLDLRHPLAFVTDVNAVLWGDYDNDGLTDAYFCRRGPNQLWRQESPGRWADVTGSTRTGNGTYDTVDGAFFDADHDGDLDIFCVNGDGPDELLNNNLDGTFRPIAEAQGLGGDGRPSRQVVVADLDRDRDTDIIVIHDQPPHGIFLNDRLWRYRAVAMALTNLDVRAAVAGDLDADGHVEVYARRADGSVLRWRPDDDRIDTVAVHGEPDGSGQGSGLAIVDLDGDGLPELRSLGEALPVVIDPARGPAIVQFSGGRPPVLRRPGPGRYGFAALRFSGMQDAGQSMRSNASGIGAHVAVRVASRWTVFDTFRSTTGPGQSLQPVAIGLGAADRIDFISIDWTDGVFQSEIDLAGAVLHTIRQTQRQTSSCPVLFAFNGRKFEFVSDLLGVGGIGFMTAPGEYATPRPWERFLLRPGVFEPLDGRYLLKIGEPMQEACYLDSMALLAYDLPPGWSMVLDERAEILGPSPTGEPRFYRRELVPIEAYTDRGEPVTELLKTADLRAAPVGALDRRFIGRLERPYSVTVIFDQSLTVPEGEPILVADGWIEYPYSQTMFGAWQAGADYVAPTVEARGADGRWRTVLEQFGYPAGMPRRMSVPLKDLPPGTDRLRITTNQEIYWDRLAVAFAETPPELSRHVLAIKAADVRRSGFAERRTGPQRQPYYDYDRRAPFWDTRHQAGMYTQFGPAVELVSTADGAMAIFGPGEELHIEFDATGPAPLPEGWTRYLVLDARGWCKDMDLYTRDGATIGPLPGTRGERAAALHEKYNTRYEAGRK